MKDHPDKEYEFNFGLKDNCDMFCIVFDLN